MNESQKYGVSIIIISLLLILLSFVLSDGWEPRLGFVDNLMTRLNVQLILKETTGEGIFKYDVYLIDVYTKYFVLAFVGSASYGLTTYLGISPAFRPWKKSSV